MCGIIGYVGGRPAAPILLDGLRRLAYRGYDSVGFAVASGEGGLDVRKAPGKIDAFEAQLGSDLPPGCTGIGHTRWATHGRPSQENAHPLCDCTGTIVVVHNGIVDNFLELKAELLAAGHHFRSETDSEVLAHLVEAAYQGDLAAAVRTAIERVEGAYGALFLSAREPGRLVAARRSSPMIIGLGQGEQFMASDIPALLPYARDVVPLHDGEVAALTAHDVTIDGEPVRAARSQQVQWPLIMTSRGGYAHYMLKEIYEQPDALTETLQGRIGSDGRVHIAEEAKLAARELGRLQRLTLLGCGTSYHASLVGRQVLTRLTGLPVEARDAAEFRLEQPFVGERELFIAVSQSGETADTLAAVARIKEQGGQVVAVCNSLGSSLTRSADGFLLTYAGPEMAVASTKTFTAQLATLLLLAVELAQVRRTLQAAQGRELTTALQALPSQMRELLATGPALEAWAHRLADTRSFIVIGRGINYPIALEGALKLQEVSYLPSLGISGGELKHGPLALLEPGVHVVAIATPGSGYDKLLNNLKEINARDGRVSAIAGADQPDLAAYVPDVVRVPTTSSIFAPLLAVVPLQLLAYSLGLARGNDVDQPRHLAKAVTVD